MKLVQSVGISVGFALSTRLGLVWQLSILVLTSILSTAGFCSVVRRRQEEVTEADAAEPIKSEVG